MCLRVHSYCGYVCSGLSGKRMLPTVLVVLSNLDVLTDTEGEEHSSSRPIVLGWLRVYIFIVWCFGCYGCIWCVRFVCRRCCYYREPVGHSLLICLRRRCCVAMSCCWTSLFDLSSTVMCQSWPLFSPWRLEAIYFLRKRRSGPPDSYRWLLDVLQSSNLIYYAIDQYCW